MLLGFDIGGTKCAVVIGHKIQEEVRIIDKLSVPTNKPVYEMIDQLCEMAETLLLKNAWSIKDVSGVGISCGGPLSSKEGVILSPPNLPGWDNVPIVSLMESRFGKRVLLDNDANACAIAEWKCGAGKGYNNLIFLTFGTGMGAGLILNGALYRGASDLAGEVGHIRLARLGPVGFGKEGSFEGFCSGGGIAQLAQIKVRKKLQMGVPVSFCESMRDLPKLSAKVVAEAASRNDPIAIDIFKTAGHYLGHGLSILIDILNPELIIIGSIFARAHHLMTEVMYEVIEQEAITTSFKSCQIVPAGLSENIGDMAALMLADTVASE